MALKRELIQKAAMALIAEFPGCGLDTACTLIADSTDASIGYVAQIITQMPQIVISGRGRQQYCTLLPKASLITRICDFLGFGRAA